MLPEADVALVRAWAAARVPEEVQDQIRVEVDVDPRAITVLECRPPWAPEQMGPEWTRLPIAQLRYTKARQEWTLYWRDRNLRFHRYELVEPTPRIQTLIQEIDTDPTGIFWG